MKVAKTLSSRLFDCTSTVKGHVLSENDLESDTVSEADVTDIPTSVSRWVSPDDLSVHEGFIGKYQQEKKSM